jgi:hypothetical protein
MMLSRMKRRWILAAAALAALAIGVSAGLGGAARVGDGGLRPLFGPRMARAEVVVVQNGQVLDYRVDQGLVLAARGDMLLLLERDRTRQAVQVAPDAAIQIDGAPGSLAQIQRGMIAVTVRIGSAPAQTVRARTPLR